MEYTVTGEFKNINFGATGLSEILQNVRTILTTIKGTVPLERGFGIDISSLDSPLEISKALMSREIIEAIREHEIRVEVSEVRYLEDEHEGKLIPIVRIRLKEGVEL